MTFYINNAGKIMAANVAVEVAKAAYTGDTRPLKRGCLGGLVAWLMWVSLVLTAFYWLIFK